jgi:hypothetical protein
MIFAISPLIDTLTLSRLSAFAAFSAIIADIFDW